MALTENLVAEKISLIALLESEYSQQNLRDSLLQRLFYVRFLLGELAGGSGGGGTSDASAAKQDEQTSYLTSISNDTSGIAYTVENSIPTIVTVLGDATDNPVPNTAQWQLKQLRNEQGNQSTTLTSINTKLPTNLTVTSGRLLIDGSGVTQPISGTVTVNAGTNLNTSALALESGGNLAGINSKLPVSLGAKTGAGSISFVPATDAITYGSGDVTASTIRVTLATNGVFASSLTGFSTYRNTALSNTAVSVKGSAGTLHGWTFVNPNTSAVYVKIYNALAANVTVGTTTVAKVISIPAGTSSNPAIFFLETQQVDQGTFTTGIAFAAVTGLADSSTTAPSTAIYCEARFK